MHRYLIMIKKQKQSKSKSAPAHGSEQILYSFEERKSMIVSPKILLLQVLLLLHQQLVVALDRFKWKVSDRCSADTGWYYVPTATTTPRICETASMELSGTRKKGRGGNVDSRPMGCYDTEYYSHWNHIATNIECSDRYKCMCTSLQVCSNILGSSQNNLECFCGSSICTANQYCQESSSTCGSTAACSNQDGSDNNLSGGNGNTCSCGTATCTSAKPYCYASSSICSATNSEKYAFLRVESGTCAAMGGFALTNTILCEKHSNMFLPSHSDWNSIQAVPKSVNTPPGCSCRLSYYGNGCYEDSTNADRLRFNSDLASNTDCSSSLPCVCQIASTPCSNSDGSVESMGSVCICGSASTVCTTGGGMFCDATVNGGTCSSSKTCSSRYGGASAVANTGGDCMCGTTTCDTSSDPWCYLPTQSCHAVKDPDWLPMCGNTNGASANSADCMCGNAACTARTGLVCDSASNTCSGPTFVIVDFGYCSLYQHLARAGDSVAECEAALDALLEPGNFLSVEERTKGEALNGAMYGPGCSLTTGMGSYPDFNSDNDLVDVRYDPDPDANVEGQDVWLAKYGDPCVCVTTSPLPACTETTGIVKNTEPCLCGSSQMYSAPPYFGKINDGGDLSPTDVTLSHLGEYCITNKDIDKGVGQKFKNALGTDLKIDFVSFCPMGFTINHVSGGWNAKPELGLKCVECSAGKFGSMVYDSVIPNVPKYDQGCSSCPAGRVNPDTGSSSIVSCEECVSGKYQYQTGQATCDSCFPGMFASDIKQGAASNAICQVCGENTYQDESFTFSCKACPGGRIIQDTGISPIKHSSVTDCIVPGGGPAPAPEIVATCKIGERSIGGKCQQCPKGTIGLEKDGERQKCTLCARGFYSDAEGMTSCKECNTNDKFCQSMPGATKASGSFPPEFMYLNPGTEAEQLKKQQEGPTVPLMSRENTNTESSMGALDKPEIETGIQITLYSVCVAIILVIVSTHRLMPLCFKNLDMVFATSHFIDDGHALRSLDSRLGTACTLSLLPLVGMLVVFVFGQPNKMLSQQPCWGGLCPIEITPTAVVPGYYGTMNIRLLALAGSPVAPCALDFFAVTQEKVSETLDTVDKTVKDQSFDCEVSEASRVTSSTSSTVCNVTYACSVASTFESPENVYMDIPEYYQYFNWTVYANSIDGTERLMVAHSFGPPANSVLVGGNGYHTGLDPDSATTVSLTATRSVVRDQTKEDKKKVSHGSLSFISRRAATVTSATSTTVGSTNKMNRIAFQLTADNAIFVTDINFKADTITRIGSVTTFFLSLLGILKFAKIGLEMLLDKLFMKRGEDAPDDVKKRQSILNEKGDTEGNGSGGGIELSALNSRVNPLLQKSGKEGSKKSKRKKKKQVEKKKPTAEEKEDEKVEVEGVVENVQPPPPSMLPPPDIQVEILLDENTGKRYSYDPESGVSEWID